MREEDSNDIYVINDLKNITNKILKLIYFSAGNGSRREAVSQKD